MTCNDCINNRASAVFCDRCGERLPEVRQYTGHQLGEMYRTGLTWEIIRDTIIARQREIDEAADPFPSFGVDPEDSEQLEALRECIDDHCLYPNKQAQDDGDYEAAVRHTAAIAFAANPPSLDASPDTDSRVLECPVASLDVAEGRRLLTDWVSADADDTGDEPAAYARLSSWLVNNAEELLDAAERNPVDDESPEEFNLRTDAQTDDECAAQLRAYLDGVIGALTDAGTIPCGEYGTAANGVRRLTEERDAAHSATDEARSLAARYRTEADQAIRERDQLQRELASIERDTLVLFAPHGVCTPAAGFTKAGWPTLKRAIQDLGRIAARAEKAEAAHRALWDAVEDWANKTREPSRVLAILAAHRPPEDYRDHLPCVTPEQRDHDRTRRRLLAKLLRAHAFVIDKRPRQPGSWADRSWNKNAIWCRSVAARLEKR